MGLYDWHVLVVEDEFDSIQLVSKILQHSGIHVEIAHNGIEALEVLSHHIPTIIVMDLSMPEMDGWETLERIRQNPSTAHIPVVAITAYHSVSVEEDAKKAGFDFYMPKPLDTQALVKHLERVING
jgi:chemosensory pili system protein ChpA (sensor histidine kinase/response regulator)